MEKTISERMQDVKQTQECASAALDASTKMFDAVQALVLHPDVTDNTRNELMSSAHDIALLINVAISEAFGFNEMLKSL